MNVHELLSNAVQLHQAGNLVQAIRGYHEVISVSPETADAWHLAGVVAHQVGQQSLSLENIQRAIKLQPNRAQYYANLAAVHLVLSDAAAAEAACRKAIELDVEPWQPFNLLGNALAAQHRFLEAIAAYTNALRRDSHNASVLCNLGVTYSAIGKWLEAENHLRQAIEVDANCLAAHNNLGNLLKSRGRYSDAQSHFQLALELDPNSHEVLTNLGNLHRVRKEFELALSYLQRSIAHSPERANTLGSLGLVHQELGDIETGVAYLRQARQLAPHSASLHSNLLYCMNLSESVTRAELFDEHQKWGKIHGRVEKTVPFRAVDLRKDRKLRIGYVSPDFRSHATAYFCEPFLLSHDPKRFEVFCYSEFDGEDETTIRLSRGVERWQTTSTYSDRDLALKVQADAIDILIDLAGHTAGNRLPAFAYRPAPVQVSFLGYPNTTGLAAIDYYLTDSVRDPADQDTLFVEKLIRLPNGSCCYRPSPKAPDLANPPVERNGYITFGSTHRIEKITTRAVGLWSHILQAVPNSRLLLYRDSLGASEWLRSRLTKLLLTAGIDQTRFEFAWPRGEPHLEAYHRMDLLLEVFPWGSGTTAYECLWMGVPLVAYLGDRSACRGAASALSHMRLPELISATESDYVSKVIELAMDLRRLAELRHSLRERMRLTVCDHVRFTRELEAAYLHMWHAYVATDR